MPADRPGFTGQATLEHTDGANWRLVHDLDYLDGQGRTWTVPAGSPTDLASVPRPVAWVVPRTGASVSPAVLHDHLWRTAVPAGQLSYRQADRTLREALLACGVPAVLAWTMWAAVRWGVLSRPRGTTGWWRDAPGVLAVTVPVVSLVLVPALLCTLALLLLAVAEVLGRVLAGRSARAISLRS